MLPSPYYAMAQPHNAQRASNESQIQLAIQAIKRNATLSQRRAASIYNVPQKTLSDWLAGKLPRRDYTTNSMRLRLTEDIVIKEYAVDLDAQGFLLRPARLEDKANLLLAARGQPLVGKNWVTSFVRRHPKLWIKFNRKYDYKRALCEDPKLVAD